MDTHILKQTKLLQQYCALYSCTNGHAIQKLDENYTNNYRKSCYLSIDSSIAHYAKAAHDIK